jgi:tripartite-type tricarboxylate transporter receptor subunit TctC
MTVFRKLVLAFAGLLAACVVASAQTYPNQAVRIVVPFTPGSATDLLARIIGEQLSMKWGQNVIVENRPGVTGMNSVAKAAPDGYNILLTSNGHSVAGILNKNLPYDPVKDLLPVTQVATVPLVLIVPPESPWKDVKEVIAAAKANPGKLNFASPGVASTTFIAGALLREAAKIDIVHIPFKGGPESITAIMRNDAQLYFAPGNISADLVVAKKVKALAIATPKRFALVPDVPTMAEAGFAFNYDSWFGILAPAGTPRPIVDKIAKDVADVLKQPDVQDKLVKQGSIGVSNTPEQFDRLIKAEMARLTKTFTDAGLAAK